MLSKVLFKAHNNQRSVSISSDAVTTTSLLWHCRHSWSKWGRKPMAMWEVLWLVSLVSASTPPSWWVTRLMCTPSPTSRVLRHSSGAQMGMCVLLLVYLNCMQCTLLTRLNAWPPEILLLSFVREKFQFGANGMRILPDCITLGRLHHLVYIYIYIYIFIYIYTHHIIVLVLCMKDIHFVISTALWFVDFISHIVQTCIMRN